MDKKKLWSLIKRAKELGADVKIETKTSKGSKIISKQ